MNVSLTPELEQLVQEKVQTGLYTSASEVVREALRLLKERDEVRRMRLDELRRELQAGIDAADRGDLADGKQFFSELREDLKRQAGAETKE